MTSARRWSRRWGAALLVAVGLGSACADRGADGDCNARVGYADAVYAPHNEADDGAPVGRALGAADVLDCGREPVEAVEVHAVRGVDPAVAVLVRAGEWRGVYVAEGAAPSSWPSVLRSP